MKIFCLVYSGVVLGFFIYLLSRMCSLIWRLTEDFEYRLFTLLFALSVVGALVMFVFEVVIPYSH
mgnify:CR=1 FL=1